MLRFSGLKNLELTGGFGHYSMVCSYACRFFSESITAEHIEVAIDQILTETGVDMEANGAYILYYR